MSPLVIGHRGAPAHLAENTLASFGLAFRLGADAVFLKSQMREFMNYCSELGGLAAAPAA